MLHSIEEFCCRAFEICADRLPYSITNETTEMESRIDADRVNCVQTNVSFLSPVCNFTDGYSVVVSLGLGLCLLLQVGIRRDLAMFVLFHLSGHS